jgi:hypothetical protein
MTCWEGGERKNETPPLSQKIFPQNLKKLKKEREKHFLH